MVTKATAPTIPMMNFWFLATKSSVFEAVSSNVENTPAVTLSLFIIKKISFYSSTASLKSKNI